MSCMSADFLSEPLGPVLAARYWSHWRTGLCASTVRLKLRPIDHRKKDQRGFKQQCFCVHVGTGKTSFQTSWWFYHLSRAQLIHAPIWVCTGHRPRINLAKVWPVLISLRFYAECKLHLFLKNKTLKIVVLLPLKSSSCSFPMSGPGIWNFPRGALSVYFFISYHGLHTWSKQYHDYHRSDLLLCVWDEVT